MVEALNEMAEAAPDGSTIVVATHGLAGRVGACQLVGLPFEPWRVIGGLSNCAWVSIDRHRSGAYWRIEAYNATGQAANRRRFRDSPGLALVSRGLSGLDHRSRPARGFGAVGSALPWHGRGQGFESPKLHSKIASQSGSGLGLSSDL